MASGRTVRRLTMALVVIGAGSFAVMNPGAVKGFCEDIYPNDPAKRQALELCFIQDHKFNRLDSDERENCYRGMLSPIGELSSCTTPNEQPTANLIDLQRAAGQGSLPRNDIRRQEQTRDAPQAPH